MKQIPTLAEHAITHAIPAPTIQVLVAKLVLLVIIDISQATGATARPDIMKNTLLSVELAIIPAEPVSHPQLLVLAACPAIKDTILQTHVPATLDGMMLGLVCASSAAILAEPVQVARLNAIHVPVQAIAP